MKLYICLIMGLGLGLLLAMRIIWSYEDQIPRLVWSQKTFYLNYVANRQKWLVCKRFGLCGRPNMEEGQWEIVGRGEARYRP
jgi:hypothetical protein